MNMALPLTFVSSLSHALRHGPGYNKHQLNQGWPTTATSSQSYIVLSSLSASSFLHYRRNFRTTSLRSNQKNHIYFCNLNNDNKPAEYAPVEDGVILPSVTSEQLESHSTWLSNELREWLDSEWPDIEARQTHADISKHVGQLYTRLRAEGVDDVGTILLGVGASLEGRDDLSSTYVNAWTVANKTSDLLVRKFTFDDRFDVKRSVTSTPTWNILDDDGEKEENKEERMSEATQENSRVASPTLADEFERYRFLQMVLDGSASKPLVNGAVAMAMGFEYNRKDHIWNGEYVRDAHFKQYGDTPPDVLGNEYEPVLTETLEYLDAQLQQGDDDGRREESLNVVIETLHGIEMTRIQTADDKDHAFRKRVIITKWLHLFGNF